MSAPHCSAVYRAVAQGESAEQVRRMIQECAQGSGERRAAAVNCAAQTKEGDAEETPLQAAHRQRRGDLVGALVDAGAVVGELLGGALTPLAVCIAYGQVESVRALLRKGHDPNEKIGWHPFSGFRGGRQLGSEFCTAAHFCLAPLAIDDSERTGARQVGCLEVLLREGRANVNVRDSKGGTPLFWLAAFHRAADAEETTAAARLLVAAGARASGVLNCYGRSPLMEAALFQNARLARFLIQKAGAPLDERSPADGRTALRWGCSYGDDSPETMAALLLDAGADIEARDARGRTPLLECVERCMTGAMRLLLARGALIDVAANDGRTPLIAGCERRSWLFNDERWPLFEEILRRSSALTRRAVLVSTSYSAVDVLARGLQEDTSSDKEGLRVHERRRWAIAELLASGAPVRPQTAPVVLPIAAALGAEQEDEMVALQAELRGWRAHEAFVGLALDVGELRAAERGLEARRARVLELEMELGAGIKSDSEDEGEGSSGDDDDDEGGGSGAGGGEG